MRSRPGYVLERRVVPRRLTTGVAGLRCTTRALTALDLATDGGVAEIDAALRRRIPLGKLWDAHHLTPNRRGRARVTQWLRESRTEPWSPLERVAHQALRAAGVRGWVANLSVALDSDLGTAYPDIAFRSLRLAFELDGWEHHRERDAFERDRLRDARLAALSWHVVRLPGGWVLAQPRASGAASAEGPGGGGVRRPGVAFDQEVSCLTTTGSSPRATRLRRSSRGPVMRSASTW